MVSIYDWFGYDVPIRKRYELIKAAGFDGVMLWWSDGFGRGEGYQEGVGYARNAGLAVENIHTPVQWQENLSLDNLEGESLCDLYLQCIQDCSDYGIPTMVVHLPGNSHPLTELGMERIKKITEGAEKCNINVAMENLRNINNVTKVLNSVDSEKIGYCYDSCHHANYDSDKDLLGKYGNRLMAIHLHDNGGERGQHQLPFDGNIDWDNVMKKIASTGYNGATSLEPMNWGYEGISIQEFLGRAYQKVKRLEALRYSQTVETADD